MYEEEHSLLDCSANHPGPSGGGSSCWRDQLIKAPGVLRKEASDLGADVVLPAVLWVKHEM